MGQGACTDDSIEQLWQFIHLCGMLADITLDPDRDGAVTWKWVANGVYSTASTYTVQFLGSHQKFDTTMLSKAHAEPKCKMFA